MTRKASVPPEQLQRLKGLYSEQRQALVHLATTQHAVGVAEQAAAAAQQAVKDAKSKADAAYQALVELMGASAAAELTGRSAGRRTNGAAHQHDADTRDADRVS